MAWAVRVYGTPLQCYAPQNQKPRVFTCRKPKKRMLFLLKFLPRFFQKSGRIPCETLRYAQNDASTVALRPYSPSINANFTYPPATLISRTNCGTAGIRISPRSAAVLFTT